jgi:glycosyltransferase involved in cell wall biosynthesis
MKVLHVSQPVDGGAAVVAAQLTESQLARGWDVAVASPERPFLSERIRQAGAAWHPWPARRSPGPSTLLETVRLTRIVAKARPDLVHLHSSKAGAAGRLALRGRTATVFQPHGWSFLAVTGPLRAATVAWERSAARWADRIICVSKAEQRLADAKGIPGRWEIVPNGVDLSAFAAAGPAESVAARARLRLAENPLVVCVGRLSAAKGQELLLAAWPYVLARVPNAELVLVGDGPDAGRLRADAPARVSFAGERADVVDWLRAADVVAVPSRWEGMSLTMLEAMAVARSVVATDVSGAREALGAGAGAIVPVDDPEALASALVARLQAPERATAEGRAGRERVQAFHDVRQVADHVAALYGRILAERRAGRPTARTTQYP